MTEQPQEEDLGCGCLASFSSLASVALLVAFVGLSLYVHYTWYLHTPISDPDANETVVVIPSGASFDQASAQLEQVGLVKLPLYVKIYAVRDGLDSKLRAGTYSVPPGLTPIQLVDLLTTGGSDEQVRLTVPEGHTIYHVADRVEQLGLANRDVFLAEARNPELLKAHGIRGESVEGYLFPDTYFFRQGTSVRTILDRMIARHQQVWGEVTASVGQLLVDELSEQYSLDVHGFVTLASIIEREAIVHDERPIIARVFYNRFDRKMRLQSDPTCVYGPEIYDSKPTPALCRDPKSRYSTYVIPALPPGPIANPGRAALRAAIAPTTNPKKSGFLYFVARGDGSRRHTFSKTYKEHVKAVKGGP
ncbi:MAG: hypothetical protein CMH57_15725 [Myxococcales bacterium]|nr:hypothetical protein [Myxococcales bacterium]